MKADLKLIPKDGPEHRREEARKVLTWALEQNFESVIIFGYDETGITSRTSEYSGRLQIIGALEAAKIKIWEG